MSPSQARNAIRKALVGIIDPKPRMTDLDAMWDHFQSSCAFCSTSLLRASRKGHADHLIPSTHGGRNHVFNRVLACATCNGDEKLDGGWVDFLRIKTPDDEPEFTRRKTRIDAWQESRRAQCRVSNETVAAALIAVDEALVAFNQACAKVRTLRPAKH